MWNDILQKSEMSTDYIKVANYINDSGYDEVGIMLGWDSWEYPLLMLLNDDIWLKHIGVENATGKYEKMLICLMLW